MNIGTLINDVIAREGGYSDHPADRGGPTRFGITQSVARTHGYGGDMRDLPRATAHDIYKQQYWDASNFAAVHKIAPGIAAELFDTGVNMGVATAIGFLQSALNALNRDSSDYPDLTIDRRIGPATLAALAAFLDIRGASGEKVLLKAMEALQGERYLALAEARPANEAFLYGWLANRLA